MLRSQLVVGSTLAALLLAGCTLPDDGASAPASPSVSEGATSEGAAPAMTTQTLAADGIELVLSVPVAAGSASDPAGSDDASPASPVTVTPDEDGSSRVSFVVPAAAAAGEATAGTGSPTPGTSDASTTKDPSGTESSPAEPPVPATIDLASPADGSLVRNSDGSVTVLDAAGTPLGGFSAPQATDDSGSPARAGVVVVAPTRAEVHAKVKGAASSGAVETASAGPTLLTVTTWLGAQGVRSATWGEREGGRSLAVDPTPWARQSGIVGEATAWAQLVAAEPEAASTTMRDQFDCHALGATDKTTWNLEPWRPDVGFLATAAARCNPT